MLADVVDAVGTHPTWMFHEHGAYLAAVRRLAYLGTDQPESGPGNIRFAKSEFFGRPLLRPGARLLSLARRLQPHAGRRDRLRPPRGVVLVEHSADITYSTSPVLSDARDWLDGSWQTTHPWGAGGVYPNFPDPDLQSWEIA
jgi:hypothetical protein